MPYGVFGAMKAKYLQGAGVLWLNGFQCTTQCQCATVVIDSDTLHRTRLAIHGHSTALEISFCQPPGAPVPTVPHVPTTLILLLSQSCRAPPRYHIGTRQATEQGHAIILAWSLR